MTFKFKTKAKLLKGVISIFSSVTEELTIIVTPDGIKCKSDDPSHVMLLDVKWPKDQFTEFDCTEQVEFAVIMTDFNTILKRIGKEDDVECSYDKEHAILTIKTQSKEYSLSLIGPDLTRKLPDVEEMKADIKCTFITTVSAINAVLEDIAFIDDYVTIIAKDGDIICKAQSMSSKGKVDFIKNIQGEGNSTYNIPYMKSVLSSIGDLSEKAVVSFGKDIPIKIEIFLTETLKIYFLLAPKVE